MKTHYFKHIANYLRHAHRGLAETALIALIAIAVAASQAVAAPPVDAGPELVAPNSSAKPQAAEAAAAVMRLPPVVAERLPPVVDTVAAPVAPAIPPRPVRSDDMEMIARQADEKIRDGMDLAQRGAIFAARANFISAIRLIAQGLDSDEMTSRHSEALGAALTAMKEAQDFLPPQGKVEGELDLAPIVAGHRTPLLKNVPPERLQSMRGLKLYFSFAQEQLSVAVGHEVAGSMALAALGKMYAAMAEKENPEVALPDTSAIVYFQAALVVLPRNYIASNDLGVLLAHKSDYLGARAALEHSVAIFRCSENLKNLSTVYRQLGDVRLAEMAARDAEAAKAAETARQRSMKVTAGGAVEWVDTETLAKASENWSDLPPRTAPAATPAAAPPIVGQAPAPFGTMTR